MTTIWLLVHRSTVDDDTTITAKTIGFFDARSVAEEAIGSLCRRFESYRSDPEGFAVYELPVDATIDRSLSDEIMFGPRRAAS
ncbi:hypothetical protein [Curtobacterium oceanosedimentum]|uniref:hypothetical protein n=1 Tax=Curtobacterium oceanosedimentum TaxID=465820 RepID=UPI0033976BDF